MSTVADPKPVSNQNGDRLVSHVLLWTATLIIAVNGLLGWFYSRLNDSIREALEASALSASELSADPNKESAFEDLDQIQRKVSRKYGAATYASASGTTKGWQIGDGELISIRNGRVYKEYCILIFDANGSVRVSSYAIGEFAGGIWLNIDRLR